jgi:hypothetical protein
MESGAVLYVVDLNQPDASSGGCLLVGPLAKKL